MGLQEFKSAIEHVDDLYAGMDMICRLDLPVSTMDHVEHVLHQTDATKENILNNSLALGAYRALATHHGLQACLDDNNKTFELPLPEINPNPPPFTRLRLTIGGINLGLFHAAKGETSIGASSLIHDGLRIIDAFAGHSRETSLTVTGLKKKLGGLLVRQSGLRLTPPIDYTRMKPYRDGISR